MGIQRPFIIVQITPAGGKAGIALAFSRITFVIKEELRHYPVVGHIMKALKLIAVSRHNPREDLKLVMREGQRFISSGGSIIIFPQATRSVEFDVEAFNSLGVKLAARAGDRACLFHGSRRGGALCV